ncbi:hypothetical protein [Hymenobacter psychrophilus]|uniref:Uncharacterized protein n=1 Tax=Hymenobacter psychrophilus TaxID=651662 RepID=A0A1H3D7C8_9BACT|nr:hypothetical protein [Hymenobacter psychrophilus]SDX62267.1 hypothetical protein SAMN04488069_102249 [Hymenobacter psychrophilus]
MLKIIAIVVGCLVVAATTGALWAFSLGQRSIRYTLHLTLLDTAGQPLPPQRVVVWKQGYPLRELRSDAAGQLTLVARESFGTSIIFGPNRPEAIPIRLHLPEVSPLFYWFNIKQTGPLAPYEVHNDYYSYNYKQWVGDFDATHATRRHIVPSDPSQTFYAVPPNGGEVLRWQGNAKLERGPKQPDGSYDYRLDLMLQQSGMEIIR